MVEHLLGINLRNRESADERCCTVNQLAGLGRRVGTVDWQLAYLWCWIGDRRRVVRRHCRGPLRRLFRCSTGYAHPAFYPRVWLDPVCLHHRDPGWPRLLCLVAHLGAQIKSVCRLVGSAGLHRRILNPQAFWRATAGHPGHLLRCRDQYSFLGRWSADIERAGGSAQRDGHHGHGLCRCLSIRDLRHPADHVVGPDGFQDQCRA